MPNFLKIDLCKYATNQNTVNCIPVGHILFLDQTLPEEVVASQNINSC